MPDYFGWTQREHKRKEFRRQQLRRPRKIGHSDERFTNPSLGKRSVFCDYPGCLKRCRGVGAGYFVTQSLPPFEEREELWKHGILDMSFYCKDHYRQTTGRQQPAWSSARCAKRQTHRNQTRHWLSCLCNCSTRVCPTAIIVAIVTIVSAFSPSLS